MSNKQVIQQIVEAFDKNDTKTVLDMMTDDIEWTMIGDRTITGKVAMREWFSKTEDMKMAYSTKNNIIIEERLAAVNGEVSCKGKDGITFHMYYCDIYELENDQVKKMTSYIIDKK